MDEPDPELAAEEQPDILFSAVAVEGGVGLLALAIGWYRGVSPWSYVRWEPGIVLWSILATLPAVLIGWLMLRFPIGPLRRLRRITRSLVTKVFSGCKLWHLAFVSAWAGVGEELLFRGVVQDWATGQYGPIAGLIIASLVFGCAHPLSAMYFGMTALMGLYLGWLWMVFDQNLLVPILVHGLYDFLMLALLVKWRGQSDESETG